MPVEVICNICGESDTKTVYRIKERFNKYGLNGNEIFNVVKCINCGLVYVNPRFSDEKLNEVYKCCLNNPEDSKRQNVSKNIEVYYQNEIEAIGKALKNHRFPESARPTVLDFGSGWGHFLKLAKNRGWNVHGIELDASRAKAANGYGLNVFNGTLEESEFSDEYFDIITAFQVLEHMTDPSDILKRLRSKLKNEGLLVLSVPNYGGLESAFFGKRWKDLHPVEHIYYFNFNSLKKILARNDYLIIDKPYVRKYSKENCFKEYLFNLLTRFINISENSFGYYPRGLTVFAQKTVCE